MSLKIFIGKNKTGKTYNLQQKTNNTNVLYIPSEIELDNFIISANIGSPTKPILTPQQIMMTFIKKIFLKTLKPIIEDKNQEIKKYCTYIKDIKKNLINNEDELVENKIINLIKEIEKEEVENSLVMFLEELPLLNQKKDKKIFEGTSSGSKIYTLFKILYESLKFLNQNNNDLKEIVLKIDEPENHCHPELANKMALLIFDLSKIVSVEISTHSPIFLEKIIRLEKSESNECVKYYYCYNKDNEFGQLLMPIFEKLDKLNYRDLKSFVCSLFSTIVFMYEGLNDETFLYSILKQNEKNYSFTLYDCGSKNNIKKIVNIFHDLGLNMYIKIIALYDLDNDEKFNFNYKNVLEIYFENNLEDYFFGNSTTNNDEKKFETKSGIKKKQGLDCSYDGIKKNSIVHNIENLLEEKKIEILKGFDNVPQSTNSSTKTEI